MKTSLNQRALFEYALVNALYQIANKANRKRHLSKAEMYTRWTTKSLLSINIFLGFHVKLTRFARSCFRYFSLYSVLSMRKCTKSVAKCCSKTLFHTTTLSSLPIQSIPYYMVHVQIVGLQLIIWTIWCESYHIVHTKIWY